MTKDEHYFLGKDGKILLIRCPKCHSENYAPAVATGKCAWCGFDANKPDEKKEND
jgi:ribosomal protein L37E